MKNRSPFDRPEFSSSRTDLLSSIAPFASLDASAASEAPGDLHLALPSRHRSSRLATFAAKAIVPTIPDRLWIVFRGGVVLNTYSMDGLETTVGLVGPGMPFGSLLDAPGDRVATALAETDLFPLSRQQLSRSPIVARNLLDSTARRLQCATELRALRGLYSTEQRLWELLQLLGEIFGRWSSAGLHLGLRMTHQRLASIAGLSRGTVTHRLGQWQACGRIRFDANQHLILPSTFCRRRAIDTAAAS